MRVRGSQPRLRLLMNAVEVSDFQNDLTKTRACRGRTTPQEQASIYCAQREGFAAGAQSTRGSEKGIRAGAPDVWCCDGLLVCQGRKLVDAAVHDARAPRPDGARRGVCSPRWKSRRQDGAQVLPLGCRASGMREPALR